MARLDRSVYVIPVIHQQLQHALGARQVQRSDGDEGTALRESRLHGGDHGVITLDQHPVLEPSGDLRICRLVLVSDGNHAREVALQIALHQRRLFPHQSHAIADRVVQDLDLVRERQAGERPHQIVHAL